MSFCFYLPNLVQIGSSLTKLWRHIHCPRWRPQHHNSTSGFVFRDFAYLGRSKSACRPNFDEISQSTDVILLFPVSENKRSPCWNSTSVFNFYVCVTIGTPFCICLPNFGQIGHPQHSYDVISIFQDGGYGIAIPLPVLFWVIWEGRDLPAEQISGDRVTFLVF